MHSNSTRRKSIATHCCPTVFMAFSGVALSLCALCSMVTGFRTLPLLCKKTHSFPADVCKLVQECLRVHVGQRCPPWVDGLFAQQLQGLGPDSEVIFTMCSSLRLNLASRHNWNWKGTTGDNNQDTDVTVTLTLYPTGYHWAVDCAHNGTSLLQDCGMDPNSKTRRPSILSCLRNSRKCFVCPDTEPRGTLEVPSSLQQWRSFSMFWLSGTAPASQATLLRWMHAAPAERCLMCKQPSPKQLNAFCSPHCAEAANTLSCRISRNRAPWHVAE